MLLDRRLSDTAGLPSFFIELMPPSAGNTSGGLRSLRPNALTANWLGLFLCASKAVYRWASSCCKKIEVLAPVAYPSSGMHEPMGLDP